MSSAIFLLTQIKILIKSDLTLSEFFFIILLLTFQTELLFVECDVWCKQPAWLQRLSRILTQDTEQHRQWSDYANAKSGQYLCWSATKMVQVFSWHAENIFINLKKKFRWYTILACAEVFMIIPEFRILRLTFLNWAENSFTDFLKFI